MLDSRQQGLVSASGQRVSRRPLLAGSDVQEHPPPMVVRRAVRTSVAIASLVFAGCAAPGSALQQARAPVAKSLPAAAMPSGVPAAQPAGSAEGLARELEEVRACSTREGDPRTWSAQPHVDFADHPYCAWDIVRSDAGLRARLILSLEPTVSLPFVPDQQPRIRVVRCGGPDPKADSSLAPLKVRDWIGIKGGFLVGYNSGEWGGGVLWYDSKRKLRQTITTENAVRIVETPHGILAFTGLAHWTGDGGHVLRLIRAGDSWRARTLDLPGSPRVILLEPDGSILVVTTRHLVRVVEGRRVERLHAGQWRGLYPTSIEQDADGALYIGMRSVVVRLRPTSTGYAEDWLTPYDLKEMDPEISGG